MLIDSHCHLDMEPLAADKEGAIERAYKAGVEQIINVGSSIRGSKASVELANSYPNIWATVGLHPHDAEAVLDLEQTIDELREMTKNDKVVAIGEIGLDYFYLEGDVASQKKQQKELFGRQLELAAELNLPVVIHTREAEEDTLKTLKEHQVSGVVHCYTGSFEFAKELLDLGFYIGFTGFITFEQDKFDPIRQVAKSVPLEKILVETDAPFLAPEPYRGKTNEPAFVVEVAKKIAELKNIPFEEFCDATVKNTKKVFNIK